MALALARLLLASCAAGACGLLVAPVQRPFATSAWLQLRMQAGPGNDEGAACPARRAALLRSIVLGQAFAAAVRPESASAALAEPPLLPNGVVFEPGGAVLAAQRAAADEEARRPQAVTAVRPLEGGDVAAMLQLTSLQGWGNTQDDLRLLLAMKGSRAFGIFSSSGQLVSMCAVTHLPPEKAWLSYVITRKDFRRRGLARQTCTAALQWLDAAHPGSEIGLYGEPTKAAPLYRELNFTDRGTTRFWSGAYSADAILSADASSSPARNGKRLVNSKVRSITVGRSTALTVGRGSLLLPALLASDESVLGASRTQALRVWQKEAPFLSWIVPDVDRRKVSKIFDMFCDRGSKRIKFEGLRDLNEKTVGILVEEAEFRSFCKRVGVDPAQGFGEDGLFEIYAQPGNDVDFDFRVLFGGDEKGGAVGTGCPRLPGGKAPWCACSENQPGDAQGLCWSAGKDGKDGPRVKGHIMGRPTLSGFQLGPLAAVDSESATALLLAALRGAAVDHKLKDRKGDVQIELLEVEGASSDARVGRQVLESLGFKAGGASTFMVRASGGESMFYPRAGALTLASSFEYA